MRLETNKILQGDVLAVAKTLPDNSVNCIVTSPPYFGLRDYQTGEWVGGDEGCDHKPGSLSRANGSTLSGGHNHGGHLLEGYPHTCKKCGATRKDDQIGMEETPEEYVAKLVEVFRELRRVLRDDGTCWLNLGDSFKDKQLQGVPWRVALALQADGWWLRSDIIWNKKNCMPSSVTDRPTTSHEYIFLLTKKAKYWYDQDAIREPVARTWDDKNIGINNMSTTGIAEGKILGRKTMPNKGLSSTLPNPAGRNRRTVWPASSPDEILSYLADKHPSVYAEIAEQTSQKSDVFTVASAPYKAAHFATFPPKLIEPCILAGCPPRVCIECGEPWVRVVEKEADNANYPNGPGGRNKEYEKHNGSLADVARWKTKTLGFTPTCQCCPLPAVHIDEFGDQWPLYNVHRPGIVLDPFIGSGTTAQVAIQNKRDWLGIELNPDYIKLAMDRIHGVQPALFVGDV